MYILKVSDKTFKTLWEVENNRVQFLGEQIIKDPKDEEDKRSNDFVEAEFKLFEALTKAKKA